MRAFVFPGQGSQKIGMGRDLAETFPAARDVFNEIDDALGEKLSTLIFEGSDDDLRLSGRLEESRVYIYNYLHKDRYRYRPQRW